MSDDPLLDHFQKLSHLIDIWFIEEPVFIEFMRIYGETYLEPEDVDAIPESVRESARDDLNRRCDKRGEFKRQIEEHAQPVLRFADDEGVSVAPLLRFLRAVNDQCKFDDLNQEDIRDAVQAAYVRYGNKSPTGVDVAPPAPSIIEDGPTDDFRFVYKGTPHFVGKGRNWDILVYLWNQGTTPVPFSDIGEHVWETTSHLRRRSDRS